MFIAAWYITFKFRSLKLIQHINIICYFRGNTIILYYKDHSVYAAFGNNCCLFWKSYKQ